MDLKKKIYYLINMICINYVINIKIKHYKKKNICIIKNN